MQVRYLKYFVTFVTVSFLFPLTMAADGDDSDSFSTRVSAEADYKVMRGLHIYASEELRLGGRDIMDRSYTELGASYKIDSHLKVALSYTAIAVYKSETTELENGMEQSRYWYDWRHRISADITGSVKVGQWRLSMRERIQGTYKTRELNNYQQSQTSWVLRSRFKVSYRFRSAPFEPYACFEPRLLLNGARWSDDGMSSLYEESVFIGHSDVYFNRLRGAAGVEWKLNSRHSLDFYGIFDYLRDKEIDARKEGSSKGTTLKSPIIWQTGYRLSIGVGYKFSF